MIEPYYVVVRARENFGLFVIEIHFFFKMTQHSYLLRIRSRDKWEKPPVAVLRDVRLSCSN